MIGVLILSIGMCLGAFSGIIAIKTKYLSNPFSRKKPFEGKWAISIGIIMIIFGLWCFFYIIIFILYFFLKIAK